MSKCEDLLFELGLEELPTFSLQPLANTLGEQLRAGLTEQDLAFGDINTYVTPRRLAVLISQCQTTQADRTIQRKGPALSAAFDSDGKPTKAAEGFARSCKTTIDQVGTLKTEKGEFLSFEQVQTGKTLNDIMPNLIQQAIKKLPIKKTMRWGASADKFVRPVHWLVLLCGHDIVDISLFGVKADRLTYGHRFHHPEAISLSEPQDYLKALQTSGFVIPDFNTRQQQISEQVEFLAQGQQAKALITPELLEEVTGLVEWPVALLGQFDKDFLAVPREALMSAMTKHQKSFPLEDQQGNLLPAFITISNLKSPQPELVIAGNERVMRARLSDAHFFYQTDLKHSLASRAAQLAHVTFQAELGSMLDKTKRIESLSTLICKLLNIDDRFSKQAALLCKSDLCADMVSEFPELQGIMGYYYALADKAQPAVALAIKEHYQPRYAGDELPSSEPGSVVAIADRIDTLVGIFGINKLPSGDKDPFALRRAAYGVLRIIIEQGLTLDLSDLIDASIASFSADFSNQNLKSDLIHFFQERLRAWYLDQGIAHDSINAVLAIQSTRPLDFHQRLQAVEHFRQLDVAESLAAANKRVSNILKQTDNHIPNDINPELLQDKAESALVSELSEKAALVSPLYQQRDYDQVLVSLADLKEPIDHFFDTVMVMVDEEDLRCNRLAILQQLRHLFLQVADISLLQG